MINLFSTLIASRSPSAPEQAGYFHSLRERQSAQYA